jgi:hypothetical protein
VPRKGVLCSAIPVCMLLIIPGFGVGGLVNAESETGHPELDLRPCLGW